MVISVQSSRPDDGDAVALIDELEAELAAIYPAESRHGFSVQKLVDQGVAFFVARVDGEAAGCGGVMVVAGEYAELKRMYVRPPFRGRGVGRALLEHLEDHARRRGVALLRLETGVHQADALKLYERAGFVRIAPFGPYSDDPLSRCYEKKIEPPMNADERG